MTNNSTERKKSSARRKQSAPAHKTVEPEQAAEAAPDTDCLRADYVPPKTEIKIPPGFALRKPEPGADYKPGTHGVIRFERFGKKDEESYIAAPCWVTAITKNNDGADYGLLIDFFNPDGRIQSLAFNRADLHSSSLITTLAAAGLCVIPGYERPFLQYLGLFNTTERVINSNKLGWMDGGRLVYIMPNGAIQKENQQRYVFQPEVHSQAHRAMYTSGNLEGWKENVCKPCEDSDFLVYKLLVGLTPILLKASRIESHIVHTYATTTTGKTTSDQAAASEWGNGADPSESPEYSYIRKWNSTSNGLEALAATHNDALLVEDELGTNNSKDAGKDVYNFSGGQGKNALNSDRSMKRQRTWRCVATSNGEVSMQEQIEKTAHAKGGQLIRSIDIQCPTDLFHKKSEKLGNGAIYDATKDVETLKSACGQYFGTAAPAFIEYLVKKYADFADMQKDIDGRLSKALKELLDKHKGLSQEQKRAIKKFALALVTGELAIDAGILPFTRERCSEAAQAMMESWLSNVPVLRDGERGIEVVRDFILKHKESRFRSLGDTTQSLILRDLAGYIATSGDTFYFTQPGFAEACEGLGYRAVAHALKDAKYLVADESNRLTSRVMVNGEQVRMYAVKKSILSYTPDDENDK